jgi:Predicted transcriptional regulators
MNGDELGKKIKMLRTSKGLTLKDLSGQTGLSISYLSLVERGLSSIATVSLQAIAKCLDVSLLYFFNDAPEAGKRKFIFRGYDQKPVVVNNLKIYLRLAHNAGKRNMDPHIAVLLPGERIEDVDYASHEGEEFHYVLEGTLTWIMEGAQYELYPGDSVHLPSRIPHNWINQTNRTVKVLTVVHPSFFDDDAAEGVPPGAGA